MDGLTELDAWTVPRSEIDHLGHMSTLYYAQRANHGAARMLETLGAAPEQLAAAGLMLAVVDRHTLFRREQLVGAPLTLRGGVAAIGPDRLELYQEMANTATGELAAMFRSGVELQSRATRAAAAIPESWRAAAHTRLVHPPGKSQPRTLPLARLGLDLKRGDFIRAGLESHLREDVVARACDEAGFKLPPPLKLYDPTHPRNHGVMNSVWGAIPGFAWPALEMRAVAARAPRAGDVLETYAALLNVSHKIIHSADWVFEARTQALVSVTHQVNIFFNLDTRRPQDMPPELRERLSRLATPQLLGS